MKPETQCPACGSTNIDKIHRSITLSEPFTESKDVDLDLFKCLDCSTEGDFLEQNDSIIETAIASLQNQALENILNDLTIEYGVSLSSIERTLELPQKTLSKWKNGSSHPTAAGYVLMKIVRSYPWILKVAENNFEPLTVRNEYLKNAISDFISLIPLTKYIGLTEGGIISNQNSFIFYLKGDAKDNETVTRQNLTSGNRTNTTNFQQIVFSEVQ
jgi:DNA-binding transcriptional regulator YiaG